MKLKKIGTLFLNVIFYMVLALLILVCVFMFKYKNEGKQPVIFGHKFYVILTGSMSPTINVGDLIMDKVVEPDEINDEDVITFKSEVSDDITTHRVKDVTNEGDNIEFTTQGDANNAEDPNKVKQENLQGKVVEVFPSWGSKVQLIQKNMAKIFMAMAAIVIITIIGCMLRKPKKVSK